MASPARPAACRDHDLGVVSADDILDGRGPGVAPSVGDADWRAAQLVARGESSHRRWGRLERKIAGIEAQPKETYAFASDLPSRRPPASRSSIVRPGRRPV